MNFSCYECFIISLFFDEKDNYENGGRSSYTDSIITYIIIYVCKKNCLYRSGQHRFSASFGSYSLSSSSSEESFFLAFFAGLMPLFFLFLPAPVSVPPFASYSLTALLYSSFIRLAFCSHS